MALGNTLIDYGGTQTRAIVRVIQSGTVNTSWAALFNVAYNGTEYSLGDSFTVNVGDTITINMKRKNSTTYNQIYVNGSVVVNKSNAVVSYDYTVQKSTDVTYQQSQSGVYTYLRAYITDSDVVAGFERKITEGKALVNSVAYSIKQGKTLVDGVAYDIGGDTPIAVIITKPSGYSGAYCIIDGTTYRDATTGIEVLAGDIIKLYCRGATENNVSIRGSITINNVVVAYIDGYGETHYDWTVPSGTKTITIALAHYRGTNQGNVVVTTT